jgi:hypothetical protein
MSDWDASTCSTLSRSSSPLPAPVSCRLLVVRGPGAKHLFELSYPTEEARDCLAKSVEEGKWQAGPFEAFSLQLLTYSWQVDKQLADFVRMFMPPGADAHMWFYHVLKEERQEMEDVWKAQEEKERQGEWEVNMEVFQPVGEGCLHVPPVHSFDTPAMPRSR